MTTTLLKIAVLLTALVSGPLNGIENSNRKIDDTLKTRITQLTGNKFKRLDLNTVEVFKNQLDSVVIIGIKQLPLTTKFLIVDTRRNSITCNWIEFAKRQQSSSSATSLNTRVIVHNNDHSRKKVLHVNSKGDVFKQENFKRGKLISTIMLDSITREAKFSTYSIPPFTAIMYDTEGLDENQIRNGKDVRRIPIVNVEWIKKVEDSFPFYTGKTATYDQGFISLTAPELGLLYIEMDNWRNY